MHQFGISATCLQIPRFSWLCNDALAVELGCSFVHLCMKGLDHSSLFHKRCSTWGHQLSCDCAFTKNGWPMEAWHKGCESRLSGSVMLLPVPFLFTSSFPLHTLLHIIITRIVVAGYLNCAHWKEELSTYNVLPKNMSQLWSTVVVWLPISWHIRSEIRRWWRWRSWQLMDVLFRNYPTQSSQTIGRRKRAGRKGDTFKSDHDLGNEETFSCTVAWVV